MDLHIVTLRPSAHSSTRSREGISEKLIDILSQLSNPSGGKSALESDDAISIKTAHNTGYIMLELIGWTYN